MTENSLARRAMADKRMKKLTAMESDVRPPQVYGDADAEFTFVTWGSTRGPVLDAVTLLQAKGKKAKLVHFSWVYPFPSEAAMKHLSAATRLIDVEQNATGQLAALIREHTGILIKEKILKYDGRPFFPEEIVEKVIHNI
jgi:2-oxoglutarate ferredoxin oxidoreductase subunit alpha